MSRDLPERIRLEFRDHDLLRHVDDPIHKDLSTVTRWGDHLFLSCDETAGVDRLCRTGERRWGDHRHFSLGELVDLPAGPAGEMDIEGLCVDGDTLWVCGSHARKRDKPKPGKHDPAKALRRLAGLDRDPNRYFLGRFPLAADDDGPVPVAEGAAHLRMDKQPSKLKHWLRKDPHVAPFLDLPCKENGFDIEGLAVSGERVWLGLRGPVLRGWALILELETKITGKGHLKARRIDGKARYRKHFLDLEGQGIRDLSIDGDDLLVLTGPTMGGDGAAAVFRWPDALSIRESGVRTEARKGGQLPYRGARDHPEGLAPWSDGQWLVVYDSPAEDRLENDNHSVTADILRLDD